MRISTAASGFRAALVLAACMLAAPLAPAAGTEAEPAPPADAVVERPAFDKFIIVPLRVHVLTATDLPEVDCKLSDDDVRRIIGKVNGVVWHAAGIHFALESIRREPAARQDDFRRLRDLVGGAPPVELYPILRPAPAEAKPGSGGDNEDVKGAAGAGAAPAGARSDRPGAAHEKFEGLHVYYVHDLPGNGVYFREDFAFVKETATLRPVPGGIDEPVPRVTAHELGHALGLPHRQRWTNLMASGTTGTLLNAAEVAAARERAGRLAGAATVSVWRERAEDAGKSGRAARARQLWSWLAEVPGGGTNEAAERRDRLQLSE